MTDGQIDNIVDKFRAALRKHRSEFPHDVVRNVLGLKNLGMECMAPFRARVEAISNLITRRVKVNRTRNAQAALDATGRRQYTDKDVVNAMPQGEGEEAEVVFFNLGRYVSNAELEKEYEIRVLKPADPYSLATVNETDQAFADQKPNATHWQDVDGKWCYAAFSRWDDGGRNVSVNRGKDDWDGGWWFGGVRKYQK
ncbi:MAG: hypothetical protein A3C58_02585 [Candidatus Staskawiczbacteria bacterium RIFCSPHIGHO2_02_FULL_34_10]|uniref:Uncharacterized protein n=1 Tax=Candidatus Staskawiczbacteria bacterium RIFCSPHIGHO2_02_FULL_34_10 TaxID=1802205 RepID=A0A1G2HVY6_9BACT|nr:MAG: hypothetical protein A3C58_02585 [Candidatus Staskawiczbacteria bacterium RIFCSPHIGHO2_02_FULL_34_10]